jgi:hypothetical protein
MKDLRDYIKVYNHFEKDFCNRVVDNLQDDLHKHTFYSHADKERFNFDDDLEISHQFNDDTLFICQSVKDVLLKYINDIQLPSLEGWDGYLDIRYNRYQTGTTMHWHADRVQEMFDGERKGIPTLSVVGVLNDDYEGGNFYMFDDHLVELKTGDVLIFPSTFMYIHKVTPVTKGTRYSWVSWVW